MRKDGQLNKICSLFILVFDLDLFYESEVNILGLFFDVENSMVILFEFVIVMLSKPHTIVVGPKPNNKIGMVYTKPQQ